MQCIIGNCGSTHQDCILCSLLRHDKTKTVGRWLHLAYITELWVTQQYCIGLGLIVHFQILDTQSGGSGNYKESQHSISP
jgi:hypothetical protein